LKGDHVTELIPADTARSETQKEVDAKNSSILSEIATKIQDSIRKGEFFCYINKPLSDKVVSILRENVYTLKDVSNQLDGCCIKIGWKRDEED
jgi:hypothetical protein